MGTNVSYVYDGDGRRIRKTVSGTSVDFFYDLAGHEIAEMSSSGLWNRGEVFAGDRHIATYNWGTTFFNHVDWLGTERSRTALSGAVSETCLALPFGDGQSCFGNETTPNHFTGKERDSESGLDYFGARYFNSNQGRWLSPDWSDTPDAIPYANLSDPQSLNLYGYVHDNPVNRLDPDGHCCSDWADYLDSKIDGVVNAHIDDVANHGDPDDAAENALTAGVLGDLAKGFTNLLRLGTDVANLSDHLAQHQYLAAANDVAQDGARIAGVAGIVVGAADAATPKGTIYRLPEQPKSGKPYIGSAEDLQARMATRKDGRTGPAAKIDTFRKGDLDHRHYKEQKQIIKHGGKQNLDNKRNAASPRRMEKLRKKFE